MPQTIDDAVINELRFFLEKINSLNHMIETTNDEKLPRLIEKLRRIEQRVALIHTFFMASSYNTATMQTQDSNTNRPSLP
ncbi:hypothetical protein BDB00DRAFT_867197 [Zychaea mexicana]|uniref:uncharacterized protein n=1 Tax=Zychaea mexicana TaxID=64656 RepID=UPI0022FE60E9|nr:uncharacterized protein BDB00DRAFT_867197 [Zychaea mexicana]KAI9498559.1 hypothetical protein BDB00DRAFT_867197 [Zychaea mexicana]